MKHLAEDQESTAKLTVLYYRRLLLGKAPQLRVEAPVQPGIRGILDFCTTLLVYQDFYEFY